LGWYFSSEQSLRACLWTWHFLPQSPLWLLTQSSTPLFLVLRIECTISL
jgi:hypothetical protein